VSTCHHCGQEIEFRYINGVCVPIHEFGSCSGDHFNEYGRKRVFIKCPQCGDMVYRVEHNGGIVWVDTLGPPWPKHVCFDLAVSRDSHSGPNQFVAISLTTPKLSSIPSSPAPRLPTKFSIQGVWRERDFRVLESAKSVPLMQQSKAPAPNSTELSSPPPKNRRKKTQTAAPGVSKAADVTDSSTHTIQSVTLFREVSVRCHLCKTLVKGKRYERHLARVHSSTESESQQSTRTQLLHQTGLNIAVPTRPENFSGQESGQHSGESLTKCPMCNASVKRNRYERHINRVHGGGISSSANRKITTDLQFPVGVKAASSNHTNSARTLHKISSDPEALTKCAFCTAKIKPENQERHLRRVHGKREKCPVQVSIRGYVN
jgi:uncharacterized C2H2 Zn-finger protein